MFSSNKNIIGNPAANNWKGFTAQVFLIESLKAMRTANMGWQPGFVLRNFYDNNRNG